MSTTHDKTNAEYMATVIASELVGHRIAKPFIDPHGGFGFELDNGTIVWIDRDAEGNGPGWLNIESGRR